jgi:hypothetical protein
MCWMNHRSQLWAEPANHTIPSLCGMPFHPLSGR